MSEKYTIGIDFGSLSARSLLARVSDGAEITDAITEYPHAVMSECLSSSGKALPHSFALQDPEDYVYAMTDSVKRVIKDSGVAPEDIIGISVDFTCCTMLPIYSDLKPLSADPRFAEEPHAYVKLWKHHAAQPYADKLNAIAKERNESWLPHYGGCISSEWMFPKLWETLDKAPDVYNAADHFLEAGDWVTSLLVGKLVKSYTFAAAKAMYIDGVGYPSSDFLAALDERLSSAVEDKLEAPLFRSGECCGKLCPEMAKELGLTENTAIGVPQPDAHIAAVSLGATNPGDLVAILGTSAPFILVQDKFACVPGTCGSLKDTVIPGLWGYESGLCCFGDLFSWAAENIAPESYLKEAQKRDMPLIKYLISLASKKKPGETGLVTLDWWNGNRSILSDSALSGMIVGMTLATKPEDIMRALIEATAFATRVIFDAHAKEGVPIKRVIATGGIAKKDPFTMQLFADVLGVKLEVPKSKLSSSLSGAIYAAAAAGYDFDTSIKNMQTSMEKVYLPNPENKQIYDELYNEYVKLHDLFGRDENSVMKRLLEIKSRKDS